MHALEKSYPLERRGRTEPGDVAKAGEESSLGDGGVGFMKPLVSFDALGLVTSCFGSWSDSPRCRFGRFGVDGEM